MIRRASIHPPRETGLRQGGAAGDVVDRLLHGDPGDDDRECRCSGDRGGLAWLGADLQWVVNGYTLVLAALLLSAGSLSDRIGAKRAFSVGLGGFTLGSGLCALAPGLGWLIAARLLQGVGAALLDAMVADPIRCLRQGGEECAWLTSLLSERPEGQGGVLTSAP
jgi:MFS family permease